MLSNGRRAGDELAVGARLPSSVEETSMRLLNDQENDSAFKADMSWRRKRGSFLGHGWALVAGSPYRKTSLVMWIECGVLHTTLPPATNG